MKKTFNKIQPIMAFHTKTGLNQYIDKHHKKPPKLFCTYTKDRYRTILSILYQMITMLQKNSNTKN